MSLTTELDDRNSPTRIFMERHFPNTRQVVGPANRQLRNVETVRPCGNPPWMTLGTAFDYRARYFFEVTPHEDLVAWRGATRVSDTPIMIQLEEDSWYGAPIVGGGPSLSKSSIEAFFENLNEAMPVLNPAGRILSQDEENLLNRYCYVLALFEDPGRGNIRRQSLLFRFQDPSTDELLSLAEPDWIEDLSALGGRFSKEFAARRSGRAILNPTFDGSADVGGADGDLILDHCLLEFKSTVKAEIQKLWLYQLLSYTLLDYCDQFQITSAGFYMARQGMTIDWPVEELTAALGCPLGLADLRREFRSAIRPA